MKNYASSSNGLGTEERILSKEVRSHVWTAYTDKKGFMQACGLPSTNDVYALDLDRVGKIVAMESGGYSQAGAKRLLRTFSLITSLPTPLTEGWPSAS
jgi:hypothetical protein